MPKGGKKKTYRRRRNSTYLAVWGGLIGTGFNIVKGYRDARAVGYGPGEALTYVMAGYSPRSETRPFDKNRLLETWAPLAIGLGIHEVVGNGHGAFGTGVGLKLNNKLRGRLKV